MSSKMPYGLLTYDIPITERSIYSKLRKAIRRQAIPLNFSAYLIPWGARDSIIQILQMVQSNKPNVIASNVIKFDDSEQDNLDKAAEKGLRMILANAMKAMNEKLSEAETEYNKAVEAIKAAHESKKDQKETDTLNNIVQANREQAVDRAIKAAKRTLDDALALGVTFNLTRQIDYAAQEFQKLIEHKIKMAEAVAMV